MLVASRDKFSIRKLKTQLSNEFEMKELGASKKILGMEIRRDRQAGKLFLSQQRYIEKVLDRFNMNDVNLFLLHLLHISSYPHIFAQIQRKTWSTCHMFLMLMLLAVLCMP